MTGGLDTRHPDAESSPGLALWRVTNGWQRQMRAALAPHGLTHVQFVLLASLVWMDRSEPVSQRDLAEHAGLDVMMTSQVLRALEAKAYVRRAPHPTDGRAIALDPTSEGIALANRAVRDVEAADAAYFGSLAPDLHAPFLAALHRLEPDRRPGPGPMVE
ncbi:MarR family winged helix-turn-helix transcriptional regulator [Agromyces sp. MMS24-JH15]|uniref:MarR family winged helix-turn-helix transcriptional regulator n=1 Tax=Agromyces sp. MMS24-JH15 TaxID=3243765 RepID=UPI003748204B